MIANRQEELIDFDRSKNSSFIHSEQIKGSRNIFKRSKTSTLNDELFQSLRSQTSYLSSSTINSQIPSLTFQNSNTHQIFTKNSEPFTKAQTQVDSPQKQLMKRVSEIHNQTLKKDRINKWGKNDKSQWKSIPYTGKQEVLNRAYLRQIDAERKKNNSSQKRKAEELKIDLEKIREYCQQKNTSQQRKDLNAKNIKENSCDQQKTLKNSKSAFLETQNVTSYIHNFKIKQKPLTKPYNPQVSQTLLKPTITSQMKQRDRSQKIDLRFTEAGLREFKIEKQKTVLKNLEDKVENIIKYRSRSRNQTSSPDRECDLKYSSPPFRKNDQSYQQTTQQSSEQKSNEYQIPPRQTKENREEFSFQQLGLNDISPRNLPDNLQQQQMESPPKPTPQRRSRAQRLQNQPGSNNKCMGSTSSQKRALINLEQSAKLQTAIFNKESGKWQSPKPQSPRSSSRCISMSSFRSPNKDGNIFFNQDHTKIRNKANPITYQDTEQSSSKKILTTAEDSIYHEYYMDQTSQSKKQSPFRSPGKSPISSKKEKSSQGRKLKIQIDGFGETKDIEGVYRSKLAQEASELMYKHKRAINKEDQIGNYH